MSLRVGQKVRTIDGREGVVDGNAWGQKDAWWIRTNGEMGLAYVTWQLTPLPEPEHIGAVECPRANLGCGVGRHYFEAGGKHFCHSRTSPCPYAWVDRVLLITYPELVICEKAGECGHPSTLCGHRIAHERDVWHGCGADRCFAQPARCIPYVPEDEAMEWVVVFGHALAKRTKDQAEQLTRGNPEYRAFKWSDGLKGGE